MKNLKTTAYAAVIVLAVIAFGCVVWLSASYFFSLNTKISQNTQNIQSIVQYINQHSQAAVPPSTQ